MAIVYLLTETSKINRYGSNYLQKHEQKDEKDALATLLEEMRTAQKQIPVTAFREMLDYCMPESHPADVEKLPVTVFSGVYNRSSGSSVLKRYNGIILVEINRLPTL